jgi:hypothetical protein
MNANKLNCFFLSIVLGFILSVGCSDGTTDNTPDDSENAAASATPSQRSKSSTPSAGEHAAATPSKPEMASQGDIPSASTADAFPTILPTLSDVSDCLQLTELKPSSYTESVFLGSGSLTYTTPEKLETVADRIQKQFAERKFQILASNTIGMQTVTFKKDDRPATILISSGTNPDESVVEMHFWGEADLSALSELPDAFGISRTQRSLRYTAPMQLDAATQALKERLAQLQWPLVRTSSTNGTLTQFSKDGFRFTCHVTRMENQELEVTSEGATASTSVYIVSGPHLDVAKLPTPDLVERLGKSSFSSLQTETFVANGTPKEVTKTCEELLQKQGWVSVNAIRPGVAETQVLFIQKGCLLQVQASAIQEGKSEVQYYATMMPFDTPAGLELRSIRVDTAAPHLSFVTTSENITRLTDFYAGHLQRTGWTMNDGQQHTSDKKSLRVFHGTHYYPVLLEIQQKGPLETWVELRPVEKTEIATLLQRAQRETKQGSTAASTEGNVAISESVEPNSVPESDASDPDAAQQFGQEELAQQLQGALEQATDELEKAGGDDAETQKMIAELKAQAEAIAAAAGASSPTDFADALTPGGTESAIEPDTIGNVSNEVDDAPAPDLLEKEVDETHGILAESFPIPKGAQDLQREADLESISYNTNQVRPHAEFIAQELKKLGFRPRGESDVDDEYGFMQFQKGNGTVRISLVKDERNKLPVRVMIVGDGLLWPGTEDEFGVDDDALVAEGDDEFSAEDDGFADEDEFATPTEHAGIPLPEKLGTVGTAGTPYRQEITATKQGELKPIVAFYRDKMGEQGWAEDQKQSVVDEAKASLVFTNGGSVVSVKLEQFGDEVDMQIAKRDAEKAKAAGMLPPAGKARIILANASSSTAKITIGDKTYELAAGVGAEDPADGKKIDVPPGTHTFTIEAETEQQQDKIKVEPGGAWGVIVIPDGGHFADRLY